MLRNANEPEAILMQDEFEALVISGKYFIPLTALKGIRSSTTEILTIIALERIVRSLARIANALEVTAQGHLKSSKRSR